MSTSAGVTAALDLALDIVEEEWGRQVALAVARRLECWSHINQVACALRFFYGVTLGQPDAAERIVRAREPQKLPVVLSADEIVRFLEVVPGLCAIGSR